MKKSRYAEEQILGILRQHEAGVKTADLCRKTADLCREHGISAATFYGWKSKFGGMDVSEAAAEGDGRRELGSEAAGCGAELARRGTEGCDPKNGWSLPV
jgi:putative transposase